MGLVVNERVDLIPKEIVEGFKTIGVGDIGHIQEFGFMDTAIRPVWRDIRICGTAVTCRMPGFDTTANRAVIDSARCRRAVHLFNDSGGTEELIVGLRNRTGAACRPRPRMTRRIHSLSTSMPVQKTRRKLKNCERPWAR